MNNGVLPQRPEFEVTVSTEDGVRVVSVSGELDLDTMGELNEALTADDGLLATTVIDLRGLTFIDSSGVSGVLGATGLTLLGNATSIAFCIVSTEPELLHCCTGVQNGLFSRWKLSRRWPKYAALSGAPLA